MSILKWLGKSLGGFLFFTFLTSAIFMKTVVQLTEYNTLQPIVASILQTQMIPGEKADEFNEIHDKMVEICNETGKKTIELGEGEETMTFNCSQIEESTPQDLFGKVILDKFDEIYYKEYDCEFIQCIRQPAEGSEVFTIFISEKAHLFFKEMLRLLWIGSGVAAVVLLVSVETWPGRARTFGLSFISIGAPFFILDFFKDTLVPYISMPEFLHSLTPIIGQLSASASADFMYLFMVGVALVIVSFVPDRLFKKGAK